LWWAAWLQCFSASPIHYADLVRHSEELALGPDLTVRVLDLETQIAIKEQLTAEKDKLLLLHLRRTLEESRKI
jgi:hypothetical protein